MITTPTVLILGAGASFPYGYPLGSALVDRVLKENLLQKHQKPSSVGDHLIGGDELLAFNFSKRQIDDFRSELRSSQAQSVDAFLEHRHEFMDIGKTAIAAQLCRCENPEQLFTYKDWYGWILERMTAGTPFDKLRQNKISFVTFNYDRSLEHYLFITIKSRYGKSDTEVANLLNTIPFIHVHGQLGLLPWQNGDGQKTEYGDCTLAAIDVARSGIKVISDNQLDGSPDFDRARQLMAESPRIGILGFGYHVVNMKRLGLPKGTNHHGTCFGMTEAEKLRIEAAYREQIKLGDPQHTALASLRSTYNFQLD